MDSSFLTLVNVGLGLFAVIMFIKMIIQFGLPNHPAKLTSYLVSLCAVLFFTFKAAVVLGFLPPWTWMKWRSLPMVTGSFALFLQVAMTMTTLSLIQQKVVSRLPLIAGLLVLAFFPSQAEVFVSLAVIAGCIFLTFSVGKARYQKRLFFKMSLFLALAFGLRFFNVYWLFVVSEVLIFFGCFYFFLFQQTFGIMALIDEKKGPQGIL